MGKNKKTSQSTPIKTTSTNNTKSKSQTSEASQPEATLDNIDKETIRKQQKIIDELLAPLDKLQGTLETMRREVTVMKQVNTKLSSEVHRNQLKIEDGKQYSHRSCVIVTGCKVPRSQTTKEEGNRNVIAQVAQEVGMDKDHIKKDADKIHPVGGPEDGKQARIVKFTTGNFKERIFIRHRQSKKSEKKKS